MKKKGFTLIELLAVIVILAIIALIATPIILGVIDKARIGAAESSALGYIDAVEKQMVLNNLDSSKPQIVDGVHNVETLTSKGVSVKGDKPSNDSLIKIENNVVKACSLKFGDHIVNCTEQGKVVGQKGGEINTEIGGTTEPTIGATKVEATETETHKGIVYLDPTNLDTVCNAENSVSTTETKTGCMKWYIYDDSGENYKMILDHNTTARVKWNDSRSNVAYETSNVKPLIDDLVTTSGWDSSLNPDIITAEEVNAITGKTDWKNNGLYYYFDSKTNTQTANATTKSRYDWLYNNTNGCLQYGCTVEDNNSYTGAGTAGNGFFYGYWTKTPYGTAGSGSTVWYVFRNGYLISLNANFTSLGLRPVITVSKSKFLVG